MNNIKINNYLTRDKINYDTKKIHRQYLKYKNTKCLKFETIKHETKLKIRPTINIIN